MGKVARERYAAEFKANVAPEAIRGRVDASRIGSEAGIHQTMIAAWKKEAGEGKAAILQQGGGRAGDERGRAGQTAHEVRSTRDREGFLSKAFCR